MAKRRQPNDGDEQDYSVQSRAVIAKKERERERAELNYEASLEKVSEVFATALKKDKKTWDNIRRDCLDGLQGGKQGRLGTKTLADRRDRGGYNTADEHFGNENDTPTGFAEYHRELPWQKDDPKADSDEDEFKDF